MFRGRWGRVGLRSSLDCDSVGATGSLATKMRPVHGVLDQSSSLEIRPDVLRDDILLEKQGMKGIKYSACCQTFERQR
ncbi:unnamed protein product [Mycena citricolor]|uniref:Uncharacterized protein n=1 Tax=Mycena citricolor TaxID=2018698 RepID=A0AAD2H3K4_9AGAR|nr:unnamed protein product [Mycena citricolor]